METMAQLELIFLSTTFFPSLFLFPLVVLSSLSCFYVCWKHRSYWMAETFSSHCIALTHTHNTQKYKLFLIFRHQYTHSINDHKQFAAQIILCIEYASTIQLASIFPHCYLRISTEFPILLIYQIGFFCLLRTIVIYCIANRFRFIRQLVVSALHLFVRFDTQIQRHFFSIISGIFSLDGVCLLVHRQCV